MTLLAPSATLVILAVFLFINEASAAVVIRPPHFGINGEYVPEARRYVGSNSNCCIIPTCDDNNQCYETLSCGYICSHGGHRPVSYGATPGYKLKEFYTKNECHFGECKDYRFMCTHCPDPREYDFSIYTVRSDCRECYNLYQ